MESNDDCKLCVLFWYSLWFLFAITKIMQQNVLYHQHVSGNLISCFCAFEMMILVFYCNSSALLDFTWSICLCYSISFTIFLICDSDFSQFQGSVSKFSSVFQAFCLCVSKHESCLWYLVFWFCILVIYIFTYVSTKHSWSSKMHL